MREKYTPNHKTSILLDWMLEKIHSVPYGVTLRWVFYRCVQERGMAKGDYAKVKTQTAKARKNFWNGWNPETLVDDTRKIYRDGGGLGEFKDWLASLKEEKPRYEVFSIQKSIVQIWFEAQAMYSQFNYYASPYRISLVPFKGDPSINHKWNIAEYLAAIYSLYRKPIKILYFGDYEPFKDRGSRAKGLTIPANAFEDIAGWFLGILARKGIIDLYKTTNAEVNEIIRMDRIGLNQNHIKDWRLPENPERPGEYQWEALSDEQARSLIEGAIEEVWDTEAIAKVKRREAEDTEKWRSILDKAIKGM